mgnify:CR=1 FL=1
MKKFAFLLFSAATVLFCGCSTSPKAGYSIVDGVIVFDVPALSLIHISEPTRPY